MGVSVSESVLSTARLVTLCGSPSAPMRLVAMRGRLSVLRLSLPAWSFVTGMTLMLLAMDWPQPAGTVKVCISPGTIVLW